MNKNENRYRNSAKKMHNALIALLDEKDFELITVRELCDKAGVTTGAVYKRYKGKEEMLFFT